MTPVPFQGWRGSFFSILTGTAPPSVSLRAGFVVIADNIVISVNVINNNNINNIIMALVYIPDGVMAKVIATGADKQKFFKEAALEKLNPKKAIVALPSSAEMNIAVVDKYGKAMISRTLAGKPILWKAKEA